MITKRVGLSLGACALSSLLFAGKAEALSVTYVFDYYTIPPHVAPHTPIPGGPFGTIKLTDSVVDPNRVDVEITINPPPAYNNPNVLEQFYINFDSSPDNPAVGNDPDFLTNHQFRLVDVNTPATGPSNTPFTAGQLLGNVGYTNGATNFNFANFVFDLNPNATSSANTFIGSLSLYNQLPAVDTPVNLDVEMFKIPSVLAGTQTIPMYAAYRTHVVNPADPANGWPDGEFWAFASSEQTPGGPGPDPNGIPEPITAALGFMSLAALGVAATRRRR